MLALYFTYIDEESNRNKFEKIYYSYRKQMVLVALSVVHNEADAEDVVHEVFFNIAAKYMSTINAIKEDKVLRNYLLTATKHAALNWMRKKKHIVYLEPEMELDDVAPIIKDDVFVDVICKRMEYENVLTAIKALDEKYRNVIYYHFVLEIPVPQVADLMQQSVATTKKQLVRGKKKLLDLLERKGGEEHDN